MHRCPKSGNIFYKQKSGLKIFSILYNCKTARYKITPAFFCLLVNTLHYQPNFNAKNFFQ